MQTNISMVNILSFVAVWAKILGRVACQSDIYTEPILRSSLPLLVNDNQRN